MKIIDKETQRSILKIIGAVLIVISIVITIFLFRPSNIESTTWILYTATQSEPYYAVIAHNEGYIPNDEYSFFSASKPIELTCEADNGILTLTDKTNEKTYTGTYTAKSSGLFGIFLKSPNYTVIIDGMEGHANISSQHPLTLFISVGKYALQFAAD